MADDIRAMTAELARDPMSLVFLQLGEALRLRGQLDAAARIAASGVIRHPDLAAAHDLYARVLVDLGDLDRAYHEWTVALEFDRRHFGAHKGLGFLCYRWGDLEGAIEHLELALAGDPADQTVVQALRRVRQGLGSPSAGAGPSQEPPPAAGPSRDGPPWRELEGGEAGVLLADGRGLVLSGRVPAPDGRDLAEEVAAHLAGAAQEAERTGRLLEMGEWRSLLVEGQTANLMVNRPTEETILLVIRDRSMPHGRLGVVADRATRLARRWLERGRP